jgi:acyl carrier protein
VLRTTFEGRAIRTTCNGGNVSDRDCEVGDAEVDVEGGVFPDGLPPKWSYRGRSGSAIVAMESRIACPQGSPIDMDMEASTAEVRGRVLTVIRNILKQNAIVADVHPETQLVDIGLDSMDMVALMLGVEAEFNITLPQPEITPENFESVRTLETMILKLGPE